MAARIPRTDRKDDAVVLTFGGGLNSRFSEKDIDDAEAAEGQNFVIELGSNLLQNRPPFIKVGTAPNGAEVRGGAVLEDRDGAITLLIQAGQTVYQTDFSTWVNVGTVASGTQLRGRSTHYWQLDDKVLITDVNLKNPVLTWDGTTLVEMPHNLTGDFLAKYCHVDLERAWFANVISNSVATPHLMVASAVEDNETLSITDKPASAATATEAFFLLTPDLRPINGFVHAFKRLVVSSTHGSVFIITGNDKTDMAIDDLYAGSGACGTESMAYFGNDVVYGRPGALETVTRTEKFGDVEVDDLTFRISPDVQALADWTLAYNARLKRLYARSGGQVNKLYVLNKTILEGDQRRSPWVPWTTNHAAGFGSAFIMEMLDPRDGLEYVWMGGNDGSLYRLESDSTAGDGGSADVPVVFTSRVFSAPFSAKAYRVEGWIEYRQPLSDVTLTIELLWTGRSIPYTRQLADITLPAATGLMVWGGGHYWGGGDYWGSAEFERLVRKPIELSGEDNQLQVRIKATGKVDFVLSEIGLQFRAEGSP